MIFDPDIDCMCALCWPTKPNCHEICFQYRIYPEYIEGMCEYCDHIECPVMPKYCKLEAFNGQLHKEDSRGKENS